MACTNHPLVTKRLAPCARCSRPFCTDCLLDLDGGTVCATCRAGAIPRTASSGADAGVADTGQPAATDGELPPWERGRELGWWTAYRRTVVAVVTGPSEFYARMEKRTASWTWLAIPAIDYTLSSIVSGVVTVLAFGPFQRWLATVQPDAAEALAPLRGWLVLGAVSGAVLAPAFGAAYAILWAGTIHVWLAVFKKARLPFAQTARGVSYAYSAYVLALVPVLGQVAAPFWAAWANMRMAQRLHGVGLGTAFLAVFWPVILVMCCCVGPYVALLAAAFSQAR